MTPTDTVMPIFDRMLGNLQHFLAKASTQAAARGYDANVLMGCRLAPDMLPLAGQIRYACISAKGGAARLADVPVPAYDPTDDLTIDAAQARIAQTIEWLHALPADALAGSEGRTLNVKVASDGRTHAFTGADFARHWVLSHFMFHIGMAYAVLRHNGIDLGKVDFIWGATPA